MTSNRYHRQELIPNWNQDNLTNARVLILGIGATGSFVSTNLILSGVGELILVDFDTIEESNLNRQLLFRTEDIGRNKAEAAKEKLQEMNPFVKITAFPNRMEDLPLKLTKNLTVIASCLDTFPGRRWANSLSAREKVPMVSGGMYALLGNVQVVIPDITPCFECQPLISKEKLAQACTPLGEMRKELSEEKEEPKLPSVATLSSIIGGLMSQEIMKIILNIGKPLDNFLFYDGLNNAFTEIQLAKNPNCPMCGENFKLKEVEVIAFRGEKVNELKMRMALAFGMADPEIQLRGRILQENTLLECKDGDKLFIIDERLAAPIKVKVKLQDKNN